MREGRGRGAESLAHAVACAAWRRSGAGPRGSDWPSRARGKRELEPGQRVARRSKCLRQ